MIIEVDDIGDLIRKGQAALNTCYYCESCAPITHNCVDVHAKQIEFEIVMAMYVFQCSRYKQKPKNPDPYDW
jgi:hypothetical protein